MAVPQGSSPELGPEGLDRPTQLMQPVGVLIVGTGHAGAQAATALRQHGFEGSILMVGRDREPPYERPPLSKECLAGEKPFEHLYIRPPTFWAEKDIELLLDQTVTQVDPVSKRVMLLSGNSPASLSAPSLPTLPERSPIFVPGSRAAWHTPPAGPDTYRHRECRLDTDRRRPGSGVPCRSGPVG